MTRLRHIQSHKASTSQRIGLKLPASLRPLTCPPPRLHQLHRRHASNVRPLYVTWGRRHSHLQGDCVAVTSSMLHLNCPLSKQAVCVLQRVHDKVLHHFLNDVSTKAARGRAMLKFATEKADSNKLWTVYVLGHCTPVLSSSDCYDFRTG